MQRHSVAFALALSLAFAACTSVEPRSNRPQRSSAKSSNTEIGRTSGIAESQDERFRVTFSPDDLTTDVTVSNRQGLASPAPAAS